MATTYERVYVDDQGESHFETVEVKFREVDYAPPADPLHLSDLEDATRVGFLTGPRGWVGDWHPTPVRQYVIPVTGEFEITVGDGSKRLFGPGRPVLLEDRTGKGHYTRMVSEEPTVVAVIHLPG